MNKPSTIPAIHSEDEVSLFTVVTNLLNNKLIIISATAIAAFISILIYSISPERWTASAYIGKPSIYSIYKIFNKNKDPEDFNSQLAEQSVYSTIQNDLFNSAMGSMTAQSIALKEAGPKTGVYEPSIAYVASVSATSKQLAKDSIESALTTANDQSILMHFPNQEAASNISAFNILSEVKYANRKSLTINLTIGIIAGLLIGCLAAHIRLLRHIYKKQ